MTAKKFNSIEGFTVGEEQIDVVDATGNVTANDLGVSGIANFSGISGVRIPGGIYGDVITTDGSGNLSFTTIEGFSGTSGFSGYSGQAGAAGASGYSGYSGAAGSNGLSGYSGVSGYSGSQGKIDVTDVTPPTPLYEGQIWLDSESLKTFVYYDNFWVEIGSTDTGLIYQRSDFTLITPSLANSGSLNLDLPGYKSYVLMTVTTSAACWIRLYTDTASRTADQSRPINTDPAAGTGVVAEIITTGNMTQKITPFVFGGNLEDPPTDLIYMRVTNLSGATANISITLKLVRLET